MRTWMIAITFLGVAFAGCTDPIDFAAAAGSASIYVKDAPTDEFSEIHVVFTEVRVHSDGNQSDDDEDDNVTDDEDDSSWVTLFESDGTDIDLLAVNGSAAAFLGEADLQAGKYTQIRIEVSHAYGIDHDGNEVDIDISGDDLKIIRPWDVHAGEETQIVVDYDLDRSLVQAGQNGWRMTPVVGMVHIEHVDDASSGDDVHQEGEVDEDLVDA